MENEFLAVVHAINKSGHYINGYEVFIHTNHYSIRYLMNKPIENGMVTIWLLLLQEFNITVLDRPGRKNLVVDFLSIIHNEEHATPINNDFHNEHIFVVSTNSPWFADVANYLFTRKLPQHLSPSEKRRIIQRSASYSWVGGELFQRDLI